VLINIKTKASFVPAIAPWFYLVTKKKPYMVRVWFLLIVKPL